MLTAFVGVGVYTFHPPPEEFNTQIRDLNRHEQAIRNTRPPNELTSVDRDQIQEINRQRNELRDAEAEARKPWGRSTSVILIVFATLAMGVSLVRADQLPVISNGLLLGGVFTMLYGVGWVLTTDTSITRFLVMSVALVITLGLRVANPAVSERARATRRQTCAARRLRARNTRELTALVERPRASAAGSRGTGALRRGRFPR